MIDRLITVLQQAGFVFSDAGLASSSEAEPLLYEEDIVDALWLALKMPLREEDAEEGIAEVNLDFPSAMPTAETVDATTVESLPQPVSVSAYLPTSELPEQGLPIQVRVASALQDTRSLARSLRPLMRKVPSRTQVTLNEVETINLIAERAVWVPVLKPVPERWLDLELVLEASEFSFIWQSTLDEFQHLLERQGAFRNVRTWRVHGVDEGQLQLVPKKSTLTAQPPTFHSPRELITASGRQLVLYVSDCRSLVWQRGQIHKWLKLWSQHGPTVIVQLLPERLWAQSELDVGVGVQVSALKPGVPNHRLIVKELSPHMQVDPAYALTLPIMTLAARSLKQVALLIAAVRGQRTPARLFDLTWVADPERERAPSIIRPQTAEERVELFLATSSPIAQRLAYMMSSVPVSLPVVHLIQEQLLRDSNPVHVAEVYSSSLLEPVRQRLSAGESMLYDFFPGVRQLLNVTASQDETIDVLQVLSQEIARTLGFSIRSFTALLSPKAEWTQEAREAILPFAQIATQTLHNLGGDYASLVQSIERDAAHVPGWIQPLEIASTLPNSNTLEFVNAQVIEPSVQNQVQSIYPDNQEAFEFSRHQESPEEIELYDYVRRLARQPSSQAQADFYRLLFDANTYPNQDAMWALRRIIDRPEFAFTGKYIINRCFYTLGNIWLQDETRHSVLKELIMQAAVRQPSQPMDRYTKAWREQFENYATSNLYVALQHQMRLLEEDIPEKQEDAKFSSNLKHLHFIQASVTVTEDIPKNLSVGIRQLRAKNIKLLHQQLNHYANSDQNLNRTLLINPTGLPDNTLKESIGQYRPDRENSIYSQANDFLQNTPRRNLKQLRQELSWYIREPLAAADSRYKKGSFVQRLDKVLQQGGDDDMLINDVSVTTILQRVLQFLVVKDIRLNNPVELKNLLDKVGDQVVTTVLLRLVLFWRRICPWLESRFGILFHVYEHQRKCDINPIVLAFEHMNVALALNYQQVGYF